MRSGHWRRVGGAAVLATLAGGCGQATRPDCLARPCAMPVAIRLNVTASGGGPVAGLSLTVSGAATGAGSCTASDSASACVVPGTAGRYDLLLKAPGFADKTMSVVVTGDTPDVDDRRAGGARDFVNFEARRMAGEVSEGMLFDIGYADGVLPALAVRERPVPNGVRAG